MSKSKKSFIIVSQFRETGNPQLSLPLETPQHKPEEFALQKCSKPQISSTPGIPPKEKHRYRVSLGNRILGDRLTLDEAIALAKRGKR